MLPLRLGPSALASLALAVSVSAGNPARTSALHTSPVERSEPLQLESVRVRAHWLLPPVAPQALVVLAHGYLRRCANLRQTSQAIATSGLMVLCLDAPMTHGNPALADSLAKRLLDGIVAPGGQPVPERIVVAGHSAGAAFAAHLGARIDENAPQRLAGVLLFDPVAAPGFDADMRSVSRLGARPVLSIFSQPQRCNAALNALPALLQEQQRARAAGGPAGGSIVLLGTGSTHVDAEGEDTDWWATLACGHPSRRHVAMLRRMAAGWAGQLARGERPAIGDGSASGPAGSPGDWQFLVADSVEAVPR